MRGIQGLEPPVSFTFERNYGVGMRGSQVCSTSPRWFHLTLEGSCEEQLSLCLRILPSACVLIVRPFDGCALQCSREELLNGGLRVRRALRAGCRGGNRLMRASRGSMPPARRSRKSPVPCRNRRARLRIGRQRVPDREPELKWWAPTVSWRSRLNLLSRNVGAIWGRVNSSGPGHWPQAGFTVRAVRPRLRLARWGWDANASGTRAIACFRSDGPFRHRGYPSQGHVQT